MFDSRRIREDFSAAAPRYEAEAGLQAQVLAQLAERMLPLLPPHARVLDAGCGTGRFAREYPGHHVTQLDIAFSMCAQAAMDSPAVNGTMESLPFVDETFDGVFSSLALQWLPDAEAAVREMRRVLKPGGVLAFSTFGPATLKEIKESFAAVDRYPHISDFAAPRAHDKTQIVTEHYPDLLALMRHLKSIGARNKMLTRRKSLMTRGQLAQVERHYRERFGSASGLPVTWEIFYSVTKK